MMLNPQRTRRLLKLQRMLGGITLVLSLAGCRADLAGPPPTTAGGEGQGDSELLLKLERRCSAFIMLGLQLPTACEVIVRRHIQP
jgi:hypothetical protein